MGFLHVAIRRADFISTTFLLNLLSYTKILIVALLTKLHILSPEEDDFINEGYLNSTSNDQVILLGGLSPTLVPAEFVTSLVKKRLQVIKYSSFLEKSSQGQEGKSTICIVCLGHVEISHEIRELSNCSHVFHKECLDSWLDEGQVTCPLCRAMLLPAHKSEKVSKTKDV